MIVCKCKSLPNIYKVGITKTNIKTGETFCIDHLEYAIECDTCGESVWARTLEDAISIWEENVGYKSALSIKDMEDLYKHFSLSMKEL